MHNQSSSLYRVRIPRHGRALAYHFPTCDAVLGGQGAEVWRVNLELGRFMRPLGLEGHHEFDGHDGSSSSTTTTTASGGAARGGTTNDIVTGVNAIDINPAHQLLAFGTETANARGTVELWDPRARSRAGLLRLPYATLMANSASSAARSAARLPGVDDDDAGGPGVAVSALASRSDGLNFAVGTSTGHTLLYDLRANRPYTIKDQGYGLPVKKIEWTAASYGVGSGDAQAQGGYVATADEKVVKIWGRETGKNLLTVTPPMAINDMHIYPDSGLMLLANEGAPMTAYYCPQLGQAPKWCRFLDNMTDDMDDEQEEVLYDDFKFIDGSELDTLNLGHLLGTPALKPYLHGYFVDLRTYTKARAIANPFQFAEYRERLVREKLEREKDSRIRAAAANSGTAATAAGQKVKVNKALAARARLAEQEAADATAAAAHEAAEQSAAKSSSSSSKKRKDRAAAANDASALLQDSRFADLFTNPDFEIDERSREYALMHPSESAQQKMAAKEAADASDDDDDEGSQEETEEEDVDEEDEEQEGEFEDLETGDVESEEEEGASSRLRSSDRLCAQVRCVVAQTRRAAGSDRSCRCRATSLRHWTEAAHASSWSVATRARLALRSQTERASHSASACATRAARRQTSASARRRRRRLCEAHRAEGWRCLSFLQSAQQRTGSASARRSAQRTSRASHNTAPDSRARETSRTRRPSSKASSRQADRGGAGSSAAPRARSCANCEAMSMLCYWQSSILSAYAACRDPCPCSAIVDSLSRARRRVRWRISLTLDESSLRRWRLRRRGRAGLLQAIVIVVFVLVKPFRILLLVVVHLVHLVERHRVRLGWWRRVRASRRRSLAAWARLGAATI